MYLRLLFSLQLCFIANNSSFSHSSVCTIHVCTYVIGVVKQCYIIVGMLSLSIVCGCDERGCGDYVGAYITAKEDLDL